MRLLLDTPPSTIAGANAVLLVRFSLAIRHNMQGQEVRTLVMNDKQTSGTYSIAWNATDGAGAQLPSGIYIARFKAVSKTGSLVQGRKMSLLSNI